MTTKLPSSRASYARFTTVPVTAAASGVPQAPVTSKPLWVRPPLRGAPNWPTGPRVPCGPRTGKKWRWSSTLPASFSFPPATPTAMR